MVHPRVVVHRVDSLHRLGHDGGALPGVGHLRRDGAEALRAFEWRLPGLHVPRRVGQQAARQARRQRGEGRPSAGRLGDGQRRPERVGQQRVGQPGRKGLEQRGPNPFVIHGDGLAQRRAGGFRQAVGLGRQHACQGVRIPNASGGVSAPRLLEDRAQEACGQRPREDPDGLRTIAKGRRHQKPAQRFGARAVRGPAHEGGDRGSPPFVNFDGHRDPQRVVHQRRRQAGNQARQGLGARPSARQRTRHAQDVAQALRAIAARRPDPCERDQGLRPRGLRLDFAQAHVWHFRNLALLQPVQALAPRQPSRLHA